jgi:hypothetical protein
VIGVLVIVNAFTFRSERSRPVATPFVTRPADTDADAGMASAGARGGGVTTGPADPLLEEPHPTITSAKPTAPARNFAMDRIFASQESSETIATAKADVGVGNGCSDLEPVEATRHW